MANIYQVIRKTSPIVDKTIEKKIYDLAGKDLKHHKLIGTAGGFSFSFCVYLATKHAENFLERVYGYRINQDNPIGKVMDQALAQANLKKPKNITVSFYERF